MRNPDLPCPHLNFVANVDVARIVAEGAPEHSVPIAYSASIEVNCAECGEPFRWTGVQAGLSQGRPMCSPNETELRAPLRPASADPDLGMSLPGFAVTWVEGDTNG
ncbi:MAG TPA: hypothetical protein VHA75_01090 [Rugosimonospora sp.]|nr:hypothetical protein [Rugosimonospora sp.]